MLRSLNDFRAEIVRRKLFTGSFKGLRLNLYRFYLVILPLGIKCAHMKYHIKPLGMTKTQGFSQDLYAYDLFLLP